MRGIGGALPSLSIASWNVNSIRVRIEAVLAWLELYRPDVLLLQEIKCLDDAFPYEALDALGYNVAVHGQKTYNGVAILSKYPLEDVVCGFPGNPDPSQARFLSAGLSAYGQWWRVASIYVPNGREVGSESYEYKLSFLTAWSRWMVEHQHPLDECFVVGGDWNIAPGPLDARGLDAPVLTDPDLWHRLAPLVSCGWADPYRLASPSGDALSWWDYRGRAFERDHGARIDWFLLSPRAVDRAVSVTYDRAPRMAPQASDHVPVTVTFDVP